MYCVYGTTYILKEATHCMQLVPSPRRMFARKDLAWNYPGT